MTDLSQGCSNKLIIFSDHTPYFVLNKAPLLYCHLVLMLCTLHKNKLHQTVFWGLKLPSLTIEHVTFSRHQIHLMLK